MAARTPAWPTSIIHEPSDVRQAKAVKAETIGAAQLPIIAEALMANGAPLAAISRRREHTADHLGGSDVDNASQAGAEHGCQRHGTFRVFTMPVLTAADSTPINAHRHSRILLMTAWLSVVPEVFQLA